MRHLFSDRHKTANWRQWLQLAVTISFSCTLAGCATRPRDPAGEARTNSRVSDAELAALPQAINLEELERQWGPAEGQPGPRVTYRAGDHPGMFFWVYVYRPKKTGKLLEEDFFVHHIVRADRIEEGGSVVWPEAKTRQSPSEAAKDFMAL